MRSLPPVLVLATLPTLVGCASVSREFQGQPTEQVWSALIAAAESPSYDSPDPGDRWTVIENEVWVSPEDARIEIYRRLRRYLHLAGSPPRYESRTWRLRVEMTDLDPPSARFVARGWAIPAWVKEEGEWYFEEVDGLLGDDPFGGAPEPHDLDHLGIDAPLPPPTSRPDDDDVPAETQPAETQPAETAPVDEEPAVDVDDLDVEPDETPDETPDAEVDVDDLLDDPGR